MLVCAHYIYHQKFTKIVFSICLYGQVTNTIYIAGDASQEPVAEAIDDEGEN